MAKVTGPLYSVSATGTIGSAFTFGNWKGTQWVRSWFKPANPNTANQQKVRARVRLAIASYKTELTAVKLFWDTEAMGMGISGVNLYVRQYALFMKNNVEAEPTNTDVNPMT